ncbi:hypothetical protein J5N97_025020 [Dioscorea zingiberensis]|uniref:WEB family protein n=1 Tax=Dioscorea zingiberensis TaxID=325984 RepID=A0A9D5H9L7_9LILI|nr:hypothetical protein J5N97_025020 [Dioscorea zingiberensis]
MLASKSKSGLSEISSNKNMPATAASRVNKIARSGSTKTDSNSPSTLQRRNSVDRLPPSIDAKHTVEQRRTSRSSATHDKPQQRTAKGSSSELLAQLGVAQQELKKANERLDLVEIEKAQALEGLKTVKRLADEANEKLTGALSAQKKAEERLEIEKSRANELEQSSIISAKKEAALEMELRKVRHELVMASEVKNAALSQADGANKIAKANEEKAVVLTEEVTRLKALLDSKLESVNEETAKMVKELDSEVVSLKHELERAKVFERKVMDMEALIEELQIKVSDAKRAEFNASDLADEWKKKAEMLQVRVEETCQSEQSSLESQALLTRQVEEANASLQEALSEIVALQGRVELLETELARHKAEIEDSDRLLDDARREALEMEHTIQVLKSEFQIVEEEKRQALDGQKAADSSTRSVSEERDRLLHEIEIAREEVEKHKKAMDGLASALHEASTEGRDLQERLLMKQTEVENVRALVVELESTLENTKEAYQLMLDEAKYEIVCLKKAIDRSDMETKNSKSEWDAKQLDLMSVVKNSEEEINTLKSDMVKAVGSLKGVEHEAREAKEDGALMLNKLRQAESDAVIANEAMKDLKAESLALKERLLDKESQLQSITKENDDLRLREATNLLKIRELSAMLPKAERRESEDNAVRDSDDEEEEHVEKVVELSSDRELEAESIDDELDYKMDGGSFDQTNGSSAENTENGSVSPAKQLEQKKKKKALLGKFGGLLKKKNNLK